MACHSRQHDTILDEVFATDLLPLWRETLGHLIHKPAETEKLGSESTDKVPGESRKCFIGVVSHLPRPFIVRDNSKIDILATKAIGDELCINNHNQ